MENVGKCRLSDILKERDMNQQELADKIGTTRQQISKYVNNKQYMTMPVAKRISEVLKVPIEELYVWTHENVDD